MRSTLIAAAIAAIMLFAFAGVSQATVPSPDPDDPVVGTLPGGDDDEATTDDEAAAADFLRRVLRRNAARLVVRGRVVGTPRIACVQREGSDPPRFVCVFRAHLLQRLRSGRWVIPTPTDVGTYEDAFAEHGDDTDETDDVAPTTMRRLRARFRLFSCIGAATVRANEDGELVARLLHSDCGRIRLTIPTPTPY